MCRLLMQGISLDVRYTAMQPVRNSCCTSFVCSYLLTSSTKADCILSSALVVHECQLTNVAPQEGGNSLQVGGGELLVVVGSVGAGKSSLLSAMLGEMQLQQVHRTWLRVVDTRQRGSFVRMPFPLALLAYSCVRVSTQCSGSSSGNRMHCILYRNDRGPFNLASAPEAAATAWVFGEVGSGSHGRCVFGLSKKVQDFNLFIR